MRRRSLFDFQLLQTTFTKSIEHVLLARALILLDVEKSLIFLYETVNTFS
jgi:hypothetical protein